MGLDMYLYARKTKARYGFCGDEVEYPKELKQFEKNGCISETTEYQIGYWRKANAIHEWFVKNCADGVDDCKPIYVSTNELKQLKDICEEILKDNTKAKELLPTQEGFFFGSTEYDEWYYNDIKKTIDLIKSILDNNILETYEIYYEASW